MGVAALACLLAAVLAPGAGAAEPPPSFGLNEEWTENADGVELAAALGANTARVPVRWDLAEPAPARYEWSRYDRVLAEMLSRGISPLLTIDGSPCWARPRTPCGTDTHYPPGRRFLDDYARFAAAASWRYRNLIGVEVWNEPNLSEFWRPAPQPNLYAKLLDKTARAVGRVRPRLPIVFGGLVPQFGPSPRGMSAPRFQRRAFRAGADRAIDAFGVHPYVYPSDDPNLIAGIRAQMSIPRQIARHFGRPRIPLWVTEFGLSTIGFGAVSEADQASRIVTLYNLLGSIHRVPVLILHRLFDVDPAAVGWQAGMGLLTVDGVRKQAFCAVAGLRRGVCPPPP